MSIPVGKQTLLALAFGPTRTGLAATVQYRLTKPDGSLLQDWTNTGVFEIGTGGYAAPYTFVTEGAYALTGRETSLGLSTNVPETIQVSTDTDAIKAKTDNLPADPASQASVLGAIPSAATIAATVWNALTSGLATVGSIGKLLAGYVAPDNTTVAALKTELDAIRADYTTARAARLDHLDRDISLGLAASAYVPPDNSDIATILADVVTLLGEVTSLLGEGADIGTILADVVTVLNDVVALQAIAAAIKAKTDLIGTARGTIASPVTDTGRINLVKGDDYKASDGRAIKYGIDSTWPSLAGGSVALKIGTEINVGGDIGSTTISFDLTRAQTASFAGSRQYEIVATLANGSVATLVVGTCSIS